MDILTLVGILLLLYGIACLSIGLAKPQAIWKLGKIQAFVQLLGEKGTVAMMLVLGVATIAGGLFLLLG
ncbi:MAG: hypothetical protein ACOYYS_16105 [Chloroflexota bacterium]